MSKIRDLDPRLIDDVARRDGRRRPALHLHVARVRHPDLLSEFSLFSPKSATDRCVELEGLLFDAYSSALDSAADAEKERARRGLASGPSRATRGKPARDELSLRRRLVQARRDRGLHRISASVT
jgi:hypothetical protein